MKKCSTHKKHHARKHEKHGWGSMLMSGLKSIGKTALKEGGKALAKKAYEHLDSHKRGHMVKTTHKGSHAMSGALHKIL